MLFLDKMGINNNSMSDEEKYYVKYKAYKKLVDEMSPSISEEMLRDIVVSRLDTAPSNYIFRG